MINGLNFEFKHFKFPCGESQFELKSFPEKAELEMEYGSNDDIVDLALLCHTLKINNIPIGKLSIPYVPFSRQDRSNSKGECFSLKWFCGLVNSIGAERVEIVDPHSDVTIALLENVIVIQQHEVFEKYFEETRDFWLISPDAGALKKIYKMAAVVPALGVIECSKLRNTFTGEITGTKVNADSLEWKKCYIVDDICDGGRTFIEIAKVLKQKEALRIILMVSHGFFTKGLEVFDGLIDEIYTRKGRVK